MKLEIKHIYAYMPYGLQIKYPDSGKIYTVEVIDEADYINNEYPLSTVIYCIETQDLSPLNFKLLLKSLSELDDGEDNTPEEIQKCCWVYTQKLISERYDVFGLIENGLAEVKE